MQFGIFDQNDRGPYPLSEQYEKRLALIEFYDRVGFRTYHMSEHHATPLSLAPSPSVFLAAVTQRTRRIRIGALVYVLPMHHPLRLAEEICMLDHLSGGRIEVGIGRGASPHELDYFGVDPDSAQAMYVEAYNVVMQALTGNELSFSGKHFRFIRRCGTRCPCRRALSGRRKTASTSSAAGPCSERGRSAIATAPNGQPPAMNRSACRSSVSTASWSAPTLIGKPWLSAAAPGHTSTGAS